MPVCLYRLSTKWRVPRAGHLQSEERQDIRPDHVALRGNWLAFGQSWLKVPLGSFVYHSSEHDEAIGGHEELDQVRDSLYRHKARLGPPQRKN